MKTRETNKNFIPVPKPSLRSFSLLELVMVIVILAILATLGYSQYGKSVESSRQAEVKASISYMRELIHEYYLKYRTLEGISTSDLGIGSILPSSCTSTFFFSYTIGTYGMPDAMEFGGERCTSGGKQPDYTGHKYFYHMSYRPATGNSSWHCIDRVTDGACWGLPR